MKSIESGHRGLRICTSLIFSLAVVSGYDLPSPAQAAPGSSRTGTTDETAAVTATGRAIPTGGGNTVDPGSGNDRGGCQPSTTDGSRPQGASLEFMTYLGGSGYDQARDVAVDDHGNIYVAGSTRSRDFPATANFVRPGAAESPAVHDYDVFVVKYDPGGNMLWSTRFGGPNHDRAYAVEVDTKGAVYVAGRAGAGFPVTEGAVQTTFMGGQPAAHYGGQDGFVAKLSSDGSKILWATYFGTSDFRGIRDIDVDPLGNVYIGSGYHGPAASRNAGALPERLRSGIAGSDPGKPPGWDSWFSGAIQSMPGGGHDAVVAKLSSDGAQVLWATYLGGESDDSSQTGSEPSVRVDSAGNAVVTFGAGPGLLTTDGAYDRTYNGGPVDIYVAKISADGRSLLFGTYVGTDAADSPEGAHSLALDSMDRVYIGGYTRSADFPTTPAAAFRTPVGGRRVNGIVIQLSANGSELLASTYLHTTGEGIDVDACDNVYMTSSSSTRDFPATWDAVQNVQNGGSDGTIIKLSPDLSSILYATLLGGNRGNQNDALRGVAVTSGGAVVAVGTAAAGWQLHNAHQDVFGGDGDVPVVRIQTGH